MGTGYTTIAEADYFNDFQNMVRDDDIAAVIDRFALRRGRDCTDRATLVAMDGVRGVIDAVKSASRLAYGGIIRLSAILSTMTESQLGLFVHVLGGGRLIEYAKSEGVSEQAAHQQWKRIVRKNPELAEMQRRRFSDGSRNEVDCGEGKGAREAK